MTSCRILEAQLFHDVQLQHMVLSQGWVVRFPCAVRCKSHQNQSTEPVSVHNYRAIIPNSCPAIDDQWHGMLGLCHSGCVKQIATSNLHPQLGIFELPVRLS
jgi:hypothetical protein